MVQEYLFTSSNNKSAIEQYSMTLQSVSLEIEDLDDSNCWIAIFSTVKNDESSAVVLSKVNDYIVANENPTVLTNDSSAYFNKVLFPHVNEFERKLRKLLYLKSVLSSDSKSAETITDLESKDLGEIFALLFTDSDFIKGVKSIIKEFTWQFTKDEILKKIGNAAETTLWDTLMGVNSVSKLRSNFSEVKGYRNDVMHAHNINTKTYRQALRLIKDINLQLDEAIGTVTQKAETRHSASNNDNFNSLISEAIKTSDEEMLSRNITSCELEIEEYNALLAQITLQLNSVQCELNQIDETIATQESSTTATESQVAALHSRRVMLAERLHMIFSEQEHLAKSLTQLRMTCCDMKNVYARIKNPNTPL